MALIKFGAMVTAISGSVGGTTFQMSKAGATMKIKPRASNRQSLRMYNTRYRLAKAANNWTLNNAAQPGTFAALAVNYIAKNKLGETYTPSAYQLYMSAAL